MKNEPKPTLIREKTDVCELDRARLDLMNPQLIEQKKQERTFEETAKPFIELTMKEGIETVWTGSRCSSLPVSTVLPGSPVHGVPWARAGSFHRCEYGASAGLMQT